MRLKTLNVWFYVWTILAKAMSTTMTATMAIRFVYLIPCFVRLEFSNLLAHILILHILY